MLSIPKLVTIRSIKAVKKQPMVFQNTTPILRIFDEHKAKKFYVDFLGFNVDWEHRFEPGLPLYMQISKGDCTIHLTEHHGDCCPGSAMRIQTDELESFQQELLAKNYQNSRPEVKKMSWGSLDMSIIDPFGNRLTFTNAIST